MIYLVPEFLVRQAQLVAQPGHVPVDPVQLLAEPFDPEAVVFELGEDAGSGGGVVPAF